jgi:histidyl-tRNA synthetase
VADVGGNPLPGVGFAMGDVVMALVLEDAGVIPDNLGNKPQVIVTVFDETTLSSSLAAAEELRKAGLRVVIYPEADKLGKQFKYADRLDIPVAVVLGPDEIQNDQVAVKNLKTREQVSVKRADMLVQIEKFLPSHP